MAEADRVPRFVQRDRIDVGIAADLPRLVGVEMHVSGDGLGVDRNGVERVRQNAAGPVERIRIAMRAAGEFNVDASGRVCNCRRLERHVDVLRPLRERPQNLALDAQQRRLRCQAAEVISEMRDVIGIEVPAVRDVSVLSDRSGRRQHPRARIDIRAGKHRRISRENVSDFVPRRQRCHVGRACLHDCVLRQQTGGTEECLTERSRDGGLVIRVDIGMEFDDNGNLSVR